MRHRFICMLPFRLSAFTYQSGETVMSLLPSVFLLRSCKTKGVALFSVSAQSSETLEYLYAALTHPAPQEEFPNRLNSWIGCVEAGQKYSKTTNSLDSSFLPHMFLYFYLTITIYRLGWEFSVKKIYILFYHLIAQDDHFHQSVLLL